MTALPGRSVKPRPAAHEVKHVEVKGLTHWCATDAAINEKMWKFFADHPRTKK